MTGASGAILAINPQTPHEARLIGAVDLSHSRVDHRHAYR